jgi:2-hydroxychromene-2-carboxylate isomerase
MRDGPPVTHTVAVRFLPSGGQRGVNAAIIAYCGDQQGFFRETHDALFLAEEFPTTEDLRFMIEGLDSEEMQACISASSTRRSLQADVDSAAVAGIPGTPSAVVGDSLILGVGAILRAIRSPTTVP